MWFAYLFFEGSERKCRFDQECKINSYCECTGNKQEGHCACLQGFYLVENGTDYTCLPGKIGNIQRDAKLYHYFLNLD